MTKNETPVVSSNSWTGGPSPKDRKFDSWTKAHPKTAFSISIAVLSLVAADRLRGWHSVSIAQFVALFLLAATSYILFYAAVVGFTYAYNWFVGRIDQSRLRELQGFGTVYVFLLLIAGYLAGLIIVPLLAARLPFFVMRHL